MSLCCLPAGALLWDYFSNCITIQHCSYLLYPAAYHVTCMSATFLLVWYGRYKHAFLLHNWALRSMAAIASYLVTCTCEDSKETKELYVYTARVSPKFLTCIVHQCSVCHRTAYWKELAASAAAYYVYTHDMHAGTARMYDATRPL